MSRRIRTAALAVALGVSILTSAHGISMAPLSPDRPPAVEAGDPHYCC